MSPVRSRSPAPGCRRYFRKDDHVRVELAGELSVKISSVRSASFHLTDPEHDLAMPTHSVYRIFGIGLVRKYALEWHFPQRGPQRQVFVAVLEEKPPVTALKMSTCIPKML